MVFKAFKSSANRSHASLLSQDQRSHDPSPTESPLQSPDIQQHRAGPPPHSQLFQQQQQQRDSVIYDDHEAQAQQYHRQLQDDLDYGPEQHDDSHQSHPHLNQLLRRSQSQRSPQPHYFTGPQPTANLIGSNPIREAETIEEDERQQQAFHSSQAVETPLVNEPPKKSKRRFFGLGHSQSAAEGGRPVLAKPPPTHLQPGASQSNTGVPGRKVSLRRKEQSQSVRLSNQIPQERGSTAQYPYTSAQSSASQLYRPESEDGTGLDPFLVQPPQTDSPVTPQEFQEYQQSAGQSQYPLDERQFHQTLQRRGTDPGHLKLSQADQEFGQHQQQHTFDQSMHPSTLQTQDAGGYQAYRPNSSGSSTNLPSDPAHPYQQDNGQPQRSASQHYSAPGYQAYNPPSGAPNQRASMQAQPQAGTANMLPPASSEGKARRSIETNSGPAQGPPREGSSLGSYGTPGQNANAPSGPSTTVYPPLNSSNPGPQYRGGPPQQQQPVGGQELGRNTPPVGARSSNETSGDLAQVMHERDTLRKWAPSMANFSY
jgi:hypothetical protein